MADTTKKVAAGKNGEKQHVRYLDITSYIVVSSNYIGCNISPVSYLIGGLEHFSIYWEFHHPNWRAPSFFRGVAKKPPTSYLTLAPSNINVGKAIHNGIASIPMVAPDPKAFCPRI